MSVTVLLREMTAADDDACRRVHAAGTLSSYGRLHPWLAAIVADPATPLEACDWTVVAEQGGEVVGYVAVTARHIENLYVTPAAQGAGVGAALLAAVASRVASPVTLRCLHDNPRARVFYERHGFRVVRSECITYHGRSLDSWFMESAP